MLGRTAARAPQLPPDNVLPREYILGTISCSQRISCHLGEGPPLVYWPEQRGLSVALTHLGLTHLGEGPEGKLNWADPKRFRLKDGLQ